VVLGSEIADAGDMSDETNQHPKGSPRGVLRRGDQIVLAALALIGLAGILLWWVSRGGGRGGVIEIDHAERRDLVFAVDANSASWPELAQLPGIGETLARRIVEERQRRGPFLDVADIPRRVQGIGPKKFQQMQPYLYLKARPPQNNLTDPEQSAN
jgi:competence protein ComEA